MTMNTSPGQQRYTQYLTAGKTQVWATGVSALAEGGANVKNQLFLGAYDDNGNLLSPAVDRGAWHRARHDGQGGGHQRRRVHD